MAQVLGVSHTIGAGGLHPHIPVLMDWGHWMVAVFTHKRQLPRIRVTRPQHIESLGAQVPQASLDELIEKRVVRYRQWGVVLNRFVCAWWIRWAVPTVVDRAVRSPHCWWHMSFLSPAKNEQIVHSATMCECARLSLHHTHGSMYNLLCMFTMLFWHLLPSMYTKSFQLHHWECNVLLCHTWLSKQELDCMDSFCMPIMDNLGWNGKHIYLISIPHYQVASWLLRLTVISVGCIAVDAPNCTSIYNYV